jgi:hypothetical protein
MPSHSFYHKRQSADWLNLSIGRPEQLGGYPHTRSNRTFAVGIGSIAHNRPTDPSLPVSHVFTYATYLWLVDLGWPVAAKGAG